MKEIKQKTCENCKYYVTNRTAPHNSFFYCVLQNCNFNFLRDE